tara:strand:+ start:217 stop:729 length:513 start_codon:yes stop_codon:yes gene_type:complete
LYAEKRLNITKYNIKNRIEVMIFKGETMLKPNSEIAKILIKKFCDYYQQRNMDKLLSLFSKESYMLGSAMNESRYGIEAIKAQLNRDWAQSDKAAIEIIEFLPAPLDASWCTVFARANLTVNNQNFSFDNLRGSIYITKENGSWKIAHMHSSFADNRNPKNHSFPVQVQI